MNLSLIHSKADFIGALIPQAEDAVHPHVFSNAFVELMVADVVKTVATTLVDRTLGKKGLELSQKMAANATSSMVASWDVDDGICPPWPWPWGPTPWWHWGPGPQPWKLGPRPEPWKEGHPVPWKLIPSAEQIELAYVLTHLSGLTTSKEFNANLKSLASEVVRGVAGKLAADFEDCGTVPRKPFPKPKGGIG